MPRAHLVIVCWGFGSVPADPAPPGEPGAAPAVKEPITGAVILPLVHWSEAPEPARARKKRCVSRHADLARLAGMLRMGGSVRG